MNNTIEKKLNKSPVKDLVLSILSDLKINDYPIEEPLLTNIKDELRKRYENGSLEMENLMIIAANILELCSRSSFSSSIGADFIGLSEADLHKDPVREVKRYLS